jgi:hypothetical protein
MPATSNVFLGNRCPHCEIGGKEAGRIYKDATWLSDKLPIGLTRQYIFGKWDPNGLLPNYDKQLRTQGQAFAKQLLDGCWRAFEGQYFDIWHPNRPGKPMVIARQLIHDNWWWTFWTGSDYGFSGSAAFSVLLARSPEGGPIYVLDVYPHDLAEARKMDVKTFARGHYKALIKMPLRYEQPQRTVAMNLGQDSWAERGDTHTLADLANEELEKYDLAFTYKKIKNRFRMNHNLQQSCSSTASRYSGRPDHPKCSCRELVRSASVWKSVNDEAETAELGPRDE